jgi:TRAP-type C4-dicarboxylate transport system substrate-binding protein
VKRNPETPESLERRRFLELSGKYGFTAAVVAGATGSLLLSEEAAAATAKEEKERQKEAKYKMTTATAYVLGASRSYPIMQLDFKENIQNMTNGQVYVKLAPGGQLGAGGALAQKVQQGTIQSAQHSLSNFAPFAPPVDLINLPYFCGANQKFVNLVRSDAWRDEVHTKVEAKGFKPLWYVVIDPRVVALRKGGDGPIKTPDDLAGIKFRVPGSKMLQQYYRTIGANPTPVAWGETPSAIKQGVADALDPAVGAGLLVQPGMVQRASSLCTGRNRVRE